MLKLSLVLTLILLTLCLSAYAEQITKTYPNGAKYAGEWKDDKRNGQGTMAYPNGATYVGEWKDNKYNGQGTFTSPDGRILKGRFNNGEFIGP